MSLTKQGSHYRITDKGAYLIALIDGVINDISTGAGGNNNALYKGAARLAGLIPHGMMTEQGVISFALEATSLPRVEAIPTIKSAIRTGRNSPLDLSCIGQADSQPPTRQSKRQQARFEAKAKQAALKEQQEIERKQHWAVRSLWEKASPVPDWVTYLTVTRGLKGCNLEGNIRFISRLKYWQAGKPDSFHPALIMAARPAPAAKVESCFRLYLSPDGSNKADLPKAKLAAASFKGLGHWVGNKDSDTLIICEGVENAYSLQLMRHDSPLICAAFSSGNMPNIPIPKGIKTVFLAGDSDAAGQAANQKTGNRLFAAGYVVKTIKPPMNKDWNDLLLEQNKGGLV